MNTVSAADGEDPYRIDPEAAAELLAPAPWGRFVVLGDGFARGADTARGRAGGPWADRVATALRATRPDLAYVNLARRDAVAAHVRAGQLGRALAFRADLAAVAAGGSDVLRDSFDADVTEAELARIVGPLRDAGVEVALLSPFAAHRAPAGQPAPADLRQGRLRLLAERVRGLALRTGAVHVDLSVHPANSDADIRDRADREVTPRGHAVAGAAVIRRLGVHLGVNGGSSVR
ncbi:GDSL-type esterase/lipase family protein (plasmid) [Streptomyces sp. BI20]|uniref:GDSL-type esterase/lipase family protein n=1 Tax=Streptomyces sp. BI20 TaxID=3403460 RepID=UPI003C71F9FC